MSLSRLSFLLSILLLVPDALAQTQVLSCDLKLDRCPTRLNGVCDDQTGTNTNPDFCSNADCWDCDKCQQFSYDCDACTSNGCYFCPGDATCYNSPDYAFNIFTHCSSASDFVTDGCQAPGTENNFFRYVVMLCYDMMFTTAPGVLFLDRGHTYIDFDPWIHIQFWM
jgi:hypothetical protein